MIPMSSTTRLWITPDQREPRRRWSAFPRTVEDPGPRRLSRAHAGFGVSWTRSAPSRRSPADHRGPPRQEKLTPAVSPMGHSRSDCRSPPRPEAATRAEQRKASRPVAAPAELRPNLVVCICTDDDLARFARALQFSEIRVPSRVLELPLSRSTDRLRRAPPPTRCLLLSGRSAQTARSCIRVERPAPAPPTGSATWDESSAPRRSPALCRAARWYPQLANWRTQSPAGPSPALVVPRVNAI